MSSLRGPDTSILRGFTITVTYHWKARGLAENSVIWIPELCAHIDTIVICLELSNRLLLLFKKSKELSRSLCVQIYVLRISSHSSQLRLRPEKWAKTMFLLKMIIQLMWRPERSLKVSQISPSSVKRERISELTGSCWPGEIQKTFQFLISKIFQGQWIFQEYL